MNDMNDMQNSEWKALQELKLNFTGRESDEAHFFRCWRHSQCRPCLDESECSWCPFTWACVPNSYPVPLLAPAYDEQICPHWAERWELRSQPFGCQVSTITSVTTIVTIASTLTVVLLLNLLFFLGRWAFRRRAKVHLGGLRLWWYDGTQVRTAEAQPLLGASQDTAPLGTGP